MWQRLFSQLGIDTCGTIKRVVTDSREVKQGDAFIALNSGWKYIDEALLAGASIVISSKPHEHDSVYVVHDTTRFLGQLARLYREALPATVIGITGSVGKTSLTQLLSQSLLLHGKVTATEGNQNNEIGSALTILSATLDTKYLVVEMGVAKPGDMQTLMEIVRPDISVVTKIGPSHLEKLHNRQGVWKEKSQILSGSIGIVNADCAWCMRSENVMTFGYHRDADICITNIQHAYDTQLVSRRYAIAAGLAVFKVLGLDANFSNISWPSARLETLQHTSGASIINDCYNANLISYIEAIQYASGFSHRLLVLGEMGGLGEEAGHYHQLLGHVLNRFHIDHVFLVGALHQSTLTTYLGEAEYMSDVSVLKSRLSQILRPEMTVLLKGSRHLKMEAVL